MQYQEFIKELLIMSILHYMIEFSDAGLEGTGSLIQSFRVAARAAKHL